MVNQINENKESRSKPPASVEAMLAEARKQGWLFNELLFIPELAGLYADASEHFIKFISGLSPCEKNNYALQVSRYLFAKAVEGVILWGHSPDGKISVLFHVKHITEKFETEVPFHLHKVVEDSMAIGESLFNAHLEWVRDQLDKKESIDLDLEIKDVFLWTPRLGICYGLSKQYDSLL